MRFHSREAAKAEIEKITRNEDAIVKRGITLPIRKGQTFNVYRIDLEYLVPNILNDRIAWKIREFEADQGRKLSNERLEDIEYVYNLIECETPNENKKTLKDLAENGQQQDAIITYDGIIIDGNRRATLLRKLFNGEATQYKRSPEDFRYLNCIVLKEDIPEDQIMALETSIQIGEDKKVDYDPICMYLKIDNLSKYYNEAQIANYMGKTEAEIKNSKEVFNVMVEYLESIGKPERFTLLSKLEDQFINTKNIFKKLDNGTYATVDDWEYTDEDVTNFKQVCYDYMRAKYEGKEYRNILVGKPNKTDGVFIKKDVWESFLEEHENIIDEADPQNENDWERLKPKFKGNLNKAAKRLEEVLADKDISCVINELEAKVRKLKEMTNKKQEMTADDVFKLKECNKEIYEIIKDFK